MRNNTEFSRYCQLSPSSEPAHISDTFLSEIWADFLGDLAGQTDGGVDDEVTVQDEDAEDEEALAGGEDDVEGEHHPVGPSVGLERLRAGQLPEREGQVGYHGADQQQQQEGVTEHLGEQVTSSSSFLSSPSPSSSSLQNHRPATAKFAGRLELSITRGEFCFCRATLLQLQQGIISAPSMYVMFVSRPAVDLLKISVT